MNTVTAKRGDTFAYRCVRKREDGSPYNLSGVAIAAALRSGSRTLPFIVAIDEPESGAFVIMMNATETLSLVPGPAKADIQFTENQVVASTEDFVVMVVEDVTE